MREFTLARKAAKYVWRCPYRKPTQVDEKKILRRTGEPVLRNTAKGPHNSGIRGTIEIRSQKRGTSNCLSKTQVSAKAQAKV